MEKKAFPGPRIYNLFPLLVGSVENWEQRLPEIAAMQFNWVFLNPIQAPGFSGSLYSIKDYYQLHPLFQGESRESADDLIKRFIQSAERQGLAVMMDLVINHTAKDSPLLSQHPQWYFHEEDGSVRSPSVADPDNPQKVTVWGDLAEINYKPRLARESLLAYWSQLIQHYTELGFQGFRCDAAYKIPGEVWARLIGAAREINPQIRFFAETLGAPLHQIEQLHSAGFDYFFNSAKWWDFHADWLLEQYEQFRHIAPSIAFPESHDTERLAAKEDSGAEQRSRMWYLFTAFFSAGVMMPIGYEYGFRRPLHVVDTRPEDWEAPLFDLSAFISATNAMKAQTPVLNEEGPQRRFTAPESLLVGLLRQREHTAECVVGLVNTDTEQVHGLELERLAEVMGVTVEAIQEITPQHRADSLVGAPQIQVAPHSMRIFHGGAA